jgi:hypothetical protein|tara:strand:+ start:2621 stop:2881 length:261 start_codon:yes stop_codon:yes gene_type:complete
VLGSDAFAEVYEASFGGDVGCFERGGASSFFDLGEAGSRFFDTASNEDDVRASSGEAFSHGTTEFTGSTNNNGGLIREVEERRHVL